MSRTDEDEIEVRKRRIMRSADTVASTRYDSTGKERMYRTVAPITLPRLKCLEGDSYDDE